MRVYVVSAYPAVRAGLSGLVRGRPGWSVLGEGTPDAAASQIAAPPNAASGPDVLLADLDGVSSAEVIDAWLAALRPARGIVALDAGAPAPGRGARGGEPARLITGVARAAGERGLAFGVLRRDASEEEILAAVGAAGSGLITLDPALADLLLAPAQRSPVPAMGGAEEEIEPLTARELEVLQLLAQGLPNKLIAQRLHISEHTAKFHVSAILMKLGAASRTEAATTAARRGLLIL
jgi:two-component system, NarL family, nitrate/nitrite response regulator NarL